jgi:outer membrane receptor protein involved in Fe transport
MSCMPSRVRPVAAALALAAAAAHGQTRSDPHRLEPVIVQAEPRVHAVRRARTGDRRTQVLWWPGGGWYAGPTLEWSPQDYPVDMANTLFVDSYAIWGLKAGRQLAKGVSFFVEGRNLSNVKYAATSGVIATANGLDSAQFWPGDGRSVYAGIEWRM